MESRVANSNALEAAVEALLSQKRDLSRDAGCKHRDHVARLEAPVAVRR